MASWSTSVFRSLHWTLQVKCQAISGIRILSVFTVVPACTGLFRFCAQCRGRTNSEVT